MGMIVNPDSFGGLVSENLKTTSRVIAEKFGKEHQVVLRAIRDLIEKNEDWGVHNFAPFKNNDLTGESTSHYEMTRDGYSMLVMGFTGKKAMEWKIKFLEAFNAMEERLKTTAVLSGPQLMAAALIEADSTMKAQATQIEAMRGDVAALDQIEAMSGSLSVRPAAKVLGIPEHRLKTWLQVNRWAFRQSGKGPLQAYTEKKNVGYLDHKHGEYTKSDGEKGISITLMITPKGLIRLAKVFSKGGTA